MKDYDFIKLIYPPIESESDICVIAREAFKSDRFETEKAILAGSELYYQFEKIDFHINGIKAIYPGYEMIGVHKLSFRTKWGTLTIGLERNMDELGLSNKGLLLKRLPLKQEI